MKILIVDVNIKNIESMTIMLKSRNYDVISASNGQEALGKLRSGKYDLVISDILMPVMDGFQLCRECKKDVYLKKICFVFYTATYIDEKDEEFALTLGAQKFIRKPQEPEIFLNLIKEVTEKSKNRKNAPKAYAELNEKEMSKLYSERLITMLEKRNLELENEIVSHNTTVSKLKEDEEKYTTFFTVAQEAIFIADIESGILLDCNEAACTLVERQKEELIGEHQSILHPPDELVDGYSESFRKHFMGEPERMLSARVVTKSGIIKDVEIKAKILNVRGKKIMQGFFNDVTERKRAEEALANEQYLLNSLIETIPDGIYFKDNNSRFIRINNMQAKRFGLNDPQEAIGKTDYDFFDEEHARPAFEDEQRIIVTGEPLIGLQEKEVWPDGHTTWVSTTKMPLRDKTGKIIGIMGISRDITEHKLAEEALQESEEKYRSIVETTTEWIWEIDVTGKHTFSNPGVTAILGYRPEEIIGQSSFPLLHAEDLSEVETKLPRLMAEKNGWRGWILRWRHKDGSYRFLESNAEPILDSTGCVRGYRGSDRDITERKKVEELLRENEEIFRYFMEYSPIYVFFWDENIRALRLSKNYETMLGKPVVELLGKNMNELFPSDLAKNMVANDMRILKEGKAITVEEERNDRFYSTIKFPIFIDGKPRYLAGYTMDITEHRHAEEALKTSEEKFRTIFNNASDGMFLFDMEARKFMMCNAACSKMLGYTGEEFLNLDIATIHPSEELPSILEQFEKILRGEEGVRSDIKFKCKDGTVFTADLSSTLVTIAKKILVLIVFRDITERLLIETELRSAKEKAEESDKLKTAFLANMSHEIRTPMNGILGFTQILRQTGTDDKKHERYLDVINNCCDRLLSVVNDIIDISKIESGIIDLQVRDINIIDLLGELNNFYSESCREKNLSLSFKNQLSDMSVFCRTDDTKLHQILSNLINNAIKFTNEGGITVTCVKKDKMLEFSVNDTGIGIDRKNQSIVFERFRQADENYTRKYGGTGLGLAIAQAYVEKLGGNIWLESVNKKGTTFYFNIPFIPVSSQELSKNEEENTKDIDWSGKKILIAEDEPSNYQYIAEVLESTKITIYHAKNGEETISFFEKDHPDLILMDIRMPKIDGYLAAKKIRQKNKKIPIIALSAYAMDIDKEKTLKAGFNDHISKPVTVATLLSSLKQYL